MNNFKKFSIVAVVLAIATAGMSLPIKAATAEKKPISQIVIQNVNIF